MDELAKEITLEMLPEGIYKDIAQAIGLENFYKLTKVVGGATIYLPKPESINGYNHPELAKKYGVTERWVRQLCGDGKMQGQIDLFDFLSESE